MKHLDPSEMSCPFAASRRETGICKMDDQNDPVTMLLRLKDVRKTAHNWKTFQSEATPGRIVIPSEVNIRETRQIPFEIDPPRHGEYRSLVEAWFKRPLEEDYTSKLTSQIETAIDEALKKNSLEAVTEMALPIQSRALTLLLNTPYEEAETWISWGTHVFRSEGEALDANKANVLYDYIDNELDKSANNPGEDLYSVLLNSDFEGRKLNKEEAKGVMVLTFAGGRDTVINALTNSIAYFAEHPESLERIRKEPEIIGKTVEELIRYFSPLTQMGRVVTEDTSVCDEDIKADTRVSLCWASANRDESVFENANDVVIDRKINPHVGFGFSHHKCLGATHARQIMKVFIKALSKKVERIEILDHKDNIEELGEFKRKVGFHSLKVKLHSKLS
ncbi:MAG: cytochrome P450 [Arcticibacterium sp.]|jgi:cytochrome P450